MGFVVILIADLASDAVSIPWWLYFLVFIFEGSLISVKYSR